MLFSSPLFVFFFLPVVLAVYFVLHPRLRNAWLLLVSLVFYAWGEPAITLVMLLSIGANYGFGLWVDRARARGRGKGVVALAVAFDLTLLVFFKYADWLWESLSAGLVALGLIDQPWAALGSHFGVDSVWHALLLTTSGAIRLPIGISFFSFHAISYVVDVYRRDGQAQRSPPDIALYVALFPQLVAGPIVRYRDIAAQIVQRTVTRAGFAYGIRRFVIGLGKKMLIANVCTEAADRVFGSATLSGVPVGELTPALAWLGIVAYTLQIYFDFSAYSDMAVGLGKMFGFTFLENFNYPYVSRSITEFWRRWHISLSTWFRDYLYIPLGGNRRGTLRTSVNLLIVFVLCGLWHGANATFLVWGLFHGASLVLERVGFGAWLERRAAAVQHAYVLLTVMVGWVFFRADTLPQAFGFLGAMAGLSGGAAVALGELRVPTSDVHLFALHANTLTWIALAAGIIGSTPWLPRLWRFLDEQRAAGKARTCFALELSGLAALCLVFVHVAMALAAGGYNPFIYFRF